MAVSPLFAVFLAVIFATVIVVSSETCSGYYDVYGNWHDSFECSLWIDGGKYCCGTLINKYCCSTSGIDLGDLPDINDLPDIDDIHIDSDGTFEIVDDNALSVGVIAAIIVCCAVCVIIGICVCVCICCCNACQSTSTTRYVTTQSNVGSATIVVAQNNQQQQYYPAPGMPQTITGGGNMPTAAINPLAQYPPPPPYPQGDPAQYNKY